MGLSSGSRRNENRFWTRPTSTGPMLWTDLRMAINTNAATSKTPMTDIADTSIASCDYPRPPRPVGRGERASDHAWPGVWAVGWDAARSRVVVSRRRDGRYAYRREMDVFRTRS